MPIRSRGGACLGAALAAVVTVAAADETSGSATLEAITVTATKRAETEQNVPLSMTTFGAAQLDEKAINTFFDYATKIPNLAFAPTGDGVGTARTISIRGISGNNVTGFYIDDTPLPDSLDPRVLDIDHIEVLRGPQGTLYGARSMGGTVRIITKEPDLEDFSAQVHGAGSSTEHTNQPNYTGDAVANIPLIKDVVALRLSTFYDYQAGYFKRSYCTDPAAAMALTCTPLSTTCITTVDNVGAVNTLHCCEAGLVGDNTDGWGFREQAGPFYGTPLWEGYKTGDRGSAYRWHIPDPVAFTKSLRVEIEHKGSQIFPDGASSGAQARTTPTSARRH